MANPNPVIRVMGMLRCAKLIEYSQFQVGEPVRTSDIFGYRAILLKGGQGKWSQHHAYKHWVDKTGLIDTLS